MAQVKQVWVRGQQKTAMSRKLHLLLEPKARTVEAMQPYHVVKVVHVARLTVDERRRAMNGVGELEQLAVGVFKRTARKEVNNRPA